MLILSQGNFRGIRHFPTLRYSYPYISTTRVRVVGFVRAAIDIPCIPVLASASRDGARGRITPVPPKWPACSITPLIRCSRNDDATCERMEAMAAGFVHCQRAFDVIPSNSDLTVRKARS